MEKETFNPEKIKLKRGEFLQYYIDGLDINYIIKKHKEYSVLTQDERDFYEQYNSKRAEANNVSHVVPQSLTWKEIEEKMNLAAKNFSDDVKVINIERKLNRKPIGKQHELKLHHKFTYLIHLFCSRCTNNENGQTNINAELLKNIIGDEYNLALYTLNRIGLIYTIGGYVIGKKSSAYRLQNDYARSIKVKPSSHVQVKRYIDKVTNKIEAHKKAKFQRLADRDKFIVERYDNCLSKLKMTRIDECKDFILTGKIYEDNKPMQKEYYKNIFTKYIIQENGTFKISEIDNDNRIYHILTNTPKDLKEYLNIKFSIDIKNSHPLLLNKLLLIYYIDNELFNNIVNKEIKHININTILISNSKPYTHYVSENIHNDLIYNNIEESLDDTKNIPLDVRKYICKTSQGQMWEELLDACDAKGLKADDRGELKAQMFAEVFYSKTRTITYKEYGSVFKSIYPNVYKVINKLKPKGEETKLSHLIMKIESELFHQILERIYKQTEYDAINIHDAVLILNTPSNENCKIDGIESIMRDVYNNYSLFPTFSIDRYN
ncbi:hypothetical protein [Dysgonomonas macrotermitis]|uniref:Uncharacterized protein n=1 Tax=Dysgonomonas macrotermitis TaxID=1346286 RepID=A0A1M5ER51_9BACT|nr:hypothetical protein [Dysgonomonas macrotermitis]SHF81492.1 hypothetical protein SAMN05444362_110110 [Dysgonomonas macrotermitis]